jgi:CubicO group peptidase (beta-lactamase class C family)
VSSATRRPLAVYLSEKIWGPYGMEQPALWMTDRTHQELGGCCLHVALRDYARFGQFVLEGGRVAGRAVVPDGWFAEATRRQQQTTSPSRGYGFQWWVAQDATFDAIGINGQLIHIDPARRLVVAMSSAWPVATAPERSAARDRMLATIAAQVDAEGRR